jgi:excisionase family DNA binding protein
MAAGKLADVVDIEQHDDNRRNKPISRFTPFEELPDPMRVEEFAAKADIGTGTVYRMIEDGALPYFRWGRLVRIPRSALLALSDATKDAEMKVAKKKAAEKKAKTKK